MATIMDIGDATTRDMFTAIERESLRAQDASVVSTPLQQRGPTLTIRVPPMSQQFSICKWARCKLIFDSQDELAEHVLVEHVTKAVPIKRKDLRLYFKVERGVSIGESSIPTSIFRNASAFESFIDDKDNVMNSQSDDSLLDGGAILPITPARHSRLRATRSPDPRQLFRAINGVSSPKITPHSTPLGPSPTMADLINSVVQSNNRLSAPPLQRYRSSSPTSFALPQSVAKANAKVARSRGVTPLNIDREETGVVEHNESLMTEESTSNPKNTQKPYNLRGTNPTPHIFRSGSLRLAPVPSKSQDFLPRSESFNDDPFTVDSGNILESQFPSASQWPDISNDGSQWNLQTQATYTYDSQSQE